MQVNAIVWDLSRENGIQAVYLDVICMLMKTEISKMSDVSKMEIQHVLKV